MLEMNNNDPDFPNQYQLFSFDYDDDIDDEVFQDDHNDDDDDDINTDENEINQDRVHSNRFEANVFRFDNLDHPNCSMMFDREQTSFLETNNLNDIDSFDVQPNGHDLKASLSLSSTSSSLSRCSSTPIPIPGANSLRRNHLSSAFSKVTKFDDDDDNVDDDVEGNQCQSSADCIDGQSLSTIEYSLPDGRRMPYYHRMAPKLANFTTENESKEKEESEKDANPIQLSRGSRSQHRFGSRFEISFDMIYNNRSCYSPPLWNGGIGSSSTGFLARFGVLSPQQLLDPKQSFINPRLKEAFSDLYCLSPYDSCRLLTPHPEIDETLLDSDGVVDAQQNPIATIIKDEDRNYESDATNLQFSMSPIYNESLAIKTKLNHREENIETCSSTDNSSIGLPILTSKSNQNRSSSNCSLNPLPDVVMMATGNREKNFAENLLKFNCQSNRRQSYHHNHHRHRNTLPSFHEVPYFNENTGVSDSSQNSSNEIKPNDPIGQFNSYQNNCERRTMSISLPIDHETLLAAGRELRQISDEFRALRMKRESSNNDFASRLIVMINQTKFVAGWYRKIFEQLQWFSMTSDSFTTTETQESRGPKLTTVQQSPTIVSKIDQIDSNVAPRTVNNSIFYADRFSKEVTDSCYGRNKSKLSNCNKTQQ
ncbi:polypeptide N-acetylgalactosaminyltransferase 2 [Sarcoptes scabiei]|nr:polypeptide N-acetylgalactosaminyltransferase 2 [Sarcoptes scabiei]